MFSFFPLSCPAPAAPSNNRGEVGEGGEEFSMQTPVERERESDSWRVWEVNSVPASNQLFRAEVLSTGTLPIVVLVENGRSNLR
jgi:hypothetical protein